jgi:hypothetical protein
MSSCFLEGRVGDSQRSFRNSRTHTGKGRIKDRKRKGASGDGKRNILGFRQSHLRLSSRVGNAHTLNGLVLFPEGMPDGLPQRLVVIGPPTRY